MSRPSSPLVCVLSLATAVFTLVGCAHQPPAQGPESSASAVTGAPPTPAEAQVASGGALFGQHCARCHGDTGRDGEAPPLVGEGALPKTPAPSAEVRKVEFRTALDVGQWVMQNMPPKKVGTLSTDEYVAVLAFALHANGVKLDAPLTVEKAGAIVLHP